MRLDVGGYAVSVNTEQPDVVDIATVYDWDGGPPA